MYVGHVVFRWTTGGVVAVALLTVNAVPAHAQHEQHQHPVPPAGAAQDHSQHGATGAPMFPLREASGTAWLPDETPMYGLEGTAGEWRLMGHGNVFVQYLNERGDRGSDQAGSINWVMGMARRPLAGGRFGIRGMFSLEPWTIPGCGYPDLLATGEVCDGEAIHDRQHPHDLFMELAAEYDRPFGGSVRWQLYAGLAGEPALGPAAYPHRVSAMPNPLAPIAHHWLDATHITFGVVTGGVYGARWKAEASAFNGREPDEHRAGLDLAALDSYSGRLWYQPTPRVALQVSAGHLREAEGGHDGEPRVDVDRITASATYHRPIGTGGLWASTIAWGRNSEEGDATQALLVESSVSLRDRHTWFGRFEVAAKPAHDLDVDGPFDTFTVSKLQAGYTRYFEAWHGLAPGVGGSVSAAFVPASLEPAYGSRVNFGFGVFFTVRPASHRM